MVSPANTPRCECGYDFSSMARTARYELEQRKGRFGTVMSLGLSLFVIGLAITLASYSATVESSGRRFILSYGPMIAGALMAMRGFAGRKRANDELKRQPS